MKKSKGFTLIELIIVVLIVGILAAVAIPAYENSVRKEDPSYPTDNGSVRSQALINELFEEVTSYKDSCDFYEDTGYYTNGEFFICSVKFKHFEELSGKYEEKNNTLSIRCPEDESKKCYIN